MLDTGLRGKIAENGTPELLKKNFLGKRKPPLKSGVGVGDGVADGVAEGVAVGGRVGVAEGVAVA
ncbi:MAG: hypothetical protein ACK451_07110, partial [Pseudanabaena sp.]